MIKEYEVGTLKHLISWEHFFFTWHVKPNTEEAERLKDDALKLLDDKSDSLHVMTLLQDFNAYSEEDDVIVDHRRIPFLRQQIPNKEGYCLCVSDFVGTKPAPLYIFASTVQHRLPTDMPDPYMGLLLQTITDRLAEAAAEQLQADLEKTALWKEGKVIRPAVGYPMIPDMSINFIIDELCPLKQIGIQLTEHGMMRPHSSVSGFMMVHPHACYFSVGPISDEQIEDYARRRQYTVAEIRKYIQSL